MRLSPSKVLRVRLPRTKTSLTPYRLPGGEILVARGVYGLARSLSDDAQGTIWRLLGLMDGHRGLPEITRALRRRQPRLEPGTVARAVRRLYRLGIVEDAAEEASAPFDEADLDRYKANRDFFSLVTVGRPLSSLEIQRRLHASRVTILGIGGVGGAVATSFAAAGVGALHLVDPDRVELSNLNRQTLFRTGDVGRPKVEAAAAALHALNPEVRISTARKRVRRPREMDPLLSGCDLFVLAADEPHEILFWTNDAAQRVGTPWLENSYAGPRSAISLLVPGRTPCFRCQEHRLEHGERRQRTWGGTTLASRGRSNPVIAPTAAIAGHYGALQGLYYLAGLPVAPLGHLLHLNLWRPQESRLIRIPFWAGCPTCGRGTSRPRARRPPRRSGRPRHPPRPP